jgi:hypothetical protein
VESPPGALHLVRRRARANRAATRSAGWRGTARPLCRWTKPTVLGLELESWPSIVRRFFYFQFLFNISKNLYKLQKMLRKYNTTQKNMKHIFV